MRWLRVFTQYTEPYHLAYINISSTLRMQKVSVWMQRWSGWRPNTRLSIWCLWSSGWEPRRWVKLQCIDSRFGWVSLHYRPQDTHLLIAISITNYTLSICLDLISEPFILVVYWWVLSAVIEKIDFFEMQLSISDKVRCTKSFFQVNSVFTLKATAANAAFTCSWKFHNSHFNLEIIYATVLFQMLADFCNVLMLLNLF